MYLCFLILVLGRCVSEFDFYLFISSFHFVYHFSFVSLMFAYFIPWFDAFAFIKLLKWRKQNSQFWLTKTFEYVFKCVRYVVIMWFTSYGPYIIRRDSYWHRSVRTKHRKAEKKNIYNDFYGAQVFLFISLKKKKAKEKINSFGKFFY